MLVLFRLAGRRTLSELTTFDFVLLLIIGEATQQALLGDDFSLINAVLVIASLISLNVGLSLIKRQFPGFGKYMDGEPMLIVEYGKFLEQRARKSRIDVHDILEAARYTQGLERLDQVKFAILARRTARSPSSPTNEPDLEADQP